MRSDFYIVIYSPLVLCLMPDIIDCPGVCNSMSICRDVPGSFQCKCQVGYSGSGRAEENCIGK